MIKLTDIYIAVNALLKGKYETYKVYGHEVIEGYLKPSFFVDLSPKKMSNDGLNFKSYAYTIRITYFQATGNEIDNLKKVDELKELFGYHLTVNDRKIPITDCDYEFVGENINILQISFEIEYLEANERIETQPVATTIILNEEER